MDWSIDQDSSNSTLIGAFDEPNFQGSPYGIPIPIIEDISYEINSDLIKRVEALQFSGSALEDPLDHLEDFERLCGLVRIKGVHEDSIKMILFSFSLKDKAATWARMVPSHLVASWDLVKKKFITRFFSKQRTAKLRSEILGFKQGIDEDLFTAWERLKEYEFCCPHHGIPKAKILGVFYRGTLEKYRRALDTASQGSFGSLNVIQGERLIENMAQSEESYKEEEEVAPIGKNWNDERFEELASKIEELSQVVFSNKEEVNVVGEQVARHRGSKGLNVEVDEHCSYMEQPHESPLSPTRAPTTRSLDNHHHGMHQAPLMQAQEASIPIAPTTPILGEETNYLKGMIRQMCEFQVKAHVDFMARLDRFEDKIGSNTMSFNSKIDDLHSHLKDLGQKLSQVESTSLASRLKDSKEQDSPPKVGCKPTTLASEEEHCNVVDDIEKGAREPKGESQEFKDQSMAIKDEEIITIAKELYGDGKEFDDWLRSEYGEEKEVIKVEKEVGPRRNDENVVGLEEAQEKESEEVKEQGQPIEEKDDFLEKARRYVPPPYEPKLPFPGRFKKQILAKQREKFMEIMEGIKGKKPLMDVLKTHPTYSRLMKELMTDKEKMEEGFVFGFENKDLGESKDEFGNGLKKEETSKKEVCVKVGELVEKGKDFEEVGYKTNLGMKTNDKEKGLVNCLEDEHFGKLESHFEKRFKEELRDLNEEATIEKVEKVKEFELVKNKVELDEKTLVKDEDLAYDSDDEYFRELGTEFEKRFKEELRVLGDDAIIEEKRRVRKDETMIKNFSICDPPPPSPKQLLRTKQRKKMARLRRAMMNIGVPLQRGEALHTFQAQIRFMKACLANKDEVEAFLATMSDLPRVKLKEKALEETQDRKQLLRTMGTSIDIVKRMAFLEKIISQLVYSLKPRIGIMKEAEKESVELRLEEPIVEKDVKGSSWKLVDKGAFKVCKDAIMEKIPLSDPILA